ncbi:MAG: Mpo1-like protein [Vicinamibacterales bacterium]
MKELGGRPMEEWVERYGHSHTHPFNRICHTFGIPLIAVSLPLFLVALFVDGFWRIPLAMFVVGWILQFAGHAVEGKPPEFFHDWRFLFVGLRWWISKVLRS